MSHEEMKHAENEIASFYYDSSESVHKSIEGLCSIIKKYSFIAMPFKGKDESVINRFLREQGSPGTLKEKEITGNSPLFFDRKPVLSIEGYLLFPTVKKTTLFYDTRTDYFIKILQPIGIKRKIVSLFANKARLIYNLSEKLMANGIKVPGVLAYGMIKKGRKPFLVMDRIKGKSLYTILNIEKGNLPYEGYLKVIDKLADLHNLGYWFGDMRIAHVFINRSEISGFVDIDSIRRNMPFRLRNLAKDLAGLNNPDLPLTYDEKIKLLKHYVARVQIKNDRNLLHLIKHYSKIRWKE
ncbi:MAG: hypothetical protein ABFR82_07665 [Nitrospirota bacterium]